MATHVRISAAAADDIKRLQKLYTRHYGLTINWAQSGVVAMAVSEEVRRVRNALAKSRDK